MIKRLSSPSIRGPKEREEHLKARPAVYALSEEERRLVREGLDELKRGETASEAEVRAVFMKYRTRRSSTSRVP